MSGTVIDVMRMQLVLNKIRETAYHAKHHFVCVCVCECVCDSAAHSVFLMVELVS